MNIIFTSPRILFPCVTEVIWVTVFRGEDDHAMDQDFADLVIPSISL